MPGFVSRFARGRVVMAATLLALAGGSSPARAEPQAAPSAAELAAARELFGAGLRAEDEGRFREALDAFGRVEKIITSPQVHYQIGLCHEKLGELVEALNAFEMAIQEGEAKRAADVVKESRAHVEALRQKVAHVTLRVPESAAGVKLQIDGRPINAALVGTAMPVDPGARRVSVRADNYAGAFEVTLEMRPGERRTVEVALGEKKGAAPKPPKATPVIAPPPPPKAPAAPARDYRQAAIAGGVTAALAAGAVATGVAAHLDHSAYVRDNVSPPLTSLSDRTSLRDAGVAKAWASTGLTVAALAGAGVTLYFLFRPQGAPPRPAAVGVIPWAGRDGAGLSLRGSL